MIDNHRDHRAVAMLSYDRWLSSNQKFALYYFEVSDGENTLQFSPSRYSDISSFESAKKAACYAHAVQTPDRYYAVQDRVALFRGSESGFERAEAFICQQQNPYDILSSQAWTLGPTSRICMVIRSFERVIHSGYLGSTVFITFLDQA
jgi:hypothetical protein